MEGKKLNTIQSISIIVTVMIAHIILNMPNHLITNTGSSVILNLIYIFSICLIIFFIAAKIFSLFPNCDIIDICEYAFGKTAKNIFSILVCIYLLVISAFVIRVFAESLVLIYFPNIDIEVVILIFIAITAILNIFGFKVISRVTLLVLPIILLAMIIVFASLSPDFVYERIYPLLGNGVYDTFVSGIR